MMNKNILHQCNFFFLFYGLFIFNNAFTADDIEKTTGSKLLLYFKPIKEENEKTKVHKNEDSCLDIYYLGNAYKVDISNHFGGKCMLTNTELETKYYVLISRNIEPLKRQSISGYKVCNDKDSQMYALNLSIKTTNGDLTYNWEIEEIDIPERALPDKTIMIYADPKAIQFSSFDTHFNHIYPDKSLIATPILILPLCIVNTTKIRAEEHKNEFSSIHIKLGHTNAK